MVYQWKRILLTPFVTAGFWTYIYTLEEGIVVRQEDKKYQVGLSGIETIVGLGLSGTKAKVFLWYDVWAKTKWW